MKLTNQFQSYESEFTLFIKQLKQERSGLEESQRLGRALLWDKEPVALDAQERTKASRVAQQAYVYQNKL
jgi:hypothetical protein